MNHYRVEINSNEANFSGNIFKKNSVTVFLHGDVPPDMFNITKYDQQIIYNVILWLKMKLNRTLRKFTSCPADKL